ncbi:MAG: hypothetical protein IJA87_04070 [Clostridia bacterium]|nr:hypothetical protein [Clostridia bacterium]
MTPVIRFACILLIAVEIIFIPLYLKKMWPTKNWHSLGYKMICATAYVALAALVTGSTGGANWYSLPMLIGFAASWLGDLMLHIPKPTKVFFGTGMVFFAVAHIFYCLAYIGVQRSYFPTVKTVSLWEILTAVIIVAAYLAVCLIKKVSFGSMLLPCAIYGIFVTIMMIKSSLLSIRLLEQDVNGMTVPAVLLLIGGISFFLSDGSLALISFDTRYKKFRLKVFNIVTYFGAQICLALSILYFV